MSKTRTITLTGRPPVRINEDDWPVEASASDYEYDGQYDFQANEHSKWRVAVRKHNDGRAIVYATYSYDSAYQGRRDLSAKRGLILKSGCTDQDICNAIAEVCDDIQSCEHYGEDAERWSTLQDECIADMPAEEI